MPDWKQEINERLASLNLEPTREAAVVEELAQYLDDHHAELLAGGATEAEAARRTLAVIGAYGVISFAVSRRAKEIGIRIALGTQKRDIYVAVLCAGARPVVLGLLVGLSLAWAGAFAQTRELQDATVAVNALDPLTFGAAALLMAAVALAAMPGTARRATGVDPIDALREE